MITLFPAICRLATPGVLTAFLLFAGVSCKPASTPSSQRLPSSPDNNADGYTSREPSAGDLNAFFQTLLPPAAKLTDLKTDPPMRMTNTSPDSNTWLVNAKLTLTPVEDLLALPSPEEAQAVDVLVSELNAQVAWHNVYARSPYAHAYGAYDVQAPAGPVPQLLVTKQAKDRPLAPVYGKVAAEWQVDHWLFGAVDLDLPQIGQPRSAFIGGPTMVKGSPEAEAFLASERRVIAEAEKKQAAIESSYAKDLLAAVQPGVVYEGKISHRLGILPCTLRFLAQSPGGDAQTATFEVRLTSEPTYQFVYSAKLITPMPFAAAATSTGSDSFQVPDNGSDAAPVGNLAVNFVRGTGGGKDESGKTLPGMVLRGQVGRYTSQDQPFVVLDRHIQGVISNYTNGQFTLSAQQKP